MISLQEVKHEKQCMIICGAVLAYLILDFLIFYLRGWVNLLLSSADYLPFKGTKGYCNQYCGRGQLFGISGRQTGAFQKT